MGKLSSAKKVDGGNGQSGCGPVFVARQPIFRKDEKIFGHEILFRGGNSSRAIIDDPNAATASVVVEGLSMVQPHCREGEKIFINFTEELLYLDLSDILDPVSTVIEVLEDVRPSREVVDACMTLKDRGYDIAIDDYDGRPGYDDLLEIADIIKVDILGRPPHEIVSMTQKVRPFKGRKLAEKIEDKRTFAMVDALGYELFQGFFFCSPEVTEGREMTASSTTRLLLLKELASPEFDISRITKIISTDVSTSYRLLRFLNSPFFGLSAKVTSIQHAVALLGEKPLRQWLTIAMVTDMRRSDPTEEIVRLAMHRARFFQLLSKTATTKRNPQALFLLGLFSKLDALFGLPMEEVTQGLPLDQELIAALNERTGPYGDWVGLVEAVEAGAWQNAEETMARRGLDQVLTAKAHALAGQWTDKVLKATATATANGGGQ